VVKNVSQHQKVRSVSKEFRAQVLVSSESEQRVDRRNLATGVLVKLFSAQSRHHSLECVTASGLSIGQGVFNQRPRCSKNSVVDAKCVNTDRPNGGFGTELAEAMGNLRPQEVQIPVRTPVVFGGGVGKTPHHAQFQF
jgi:hypothetical protein